MWFEVAGEVLAEGGFNARYGSLLRHHDGLGGDPAKATRWLDREPTEGEWNVTLAALCTREVHVRRPGNAFKRVEPHLVTGGGHQGRMPTKHSLKTCKISAYVALRLHPDYAVEPGAHAGSRIERMSVSGMETQIKALRPTGLAVALRYARAAFGVSVAEIDRMVFEAMQRYVAELGLARIPRVDTWASVTKWAAECVTGGVAHCSGAVVIWDAEVEEIEELVEDA